MFEISFPDSKSDSWDRTTAGREAREDFEPLAEDEPVTASDPPGPRSPGPAPLTAGGAIRRARDLLDAAKLEAEEIRRTALRAAAGERRRGFVEGRRDGACVAAEASRAQERLSETWCAAVTKQLSELVWQVAAEVVGGEILTRPETIAVRLRRALSESGLDRWKEPPGDAVIEMHPEDLEAAPAALGFPLQINDCLARGDADIVVDEGATRIECRPAAHLEAIRALFDSSDALAELMNECASMSEESTEQELT